MGGQLGCWMQRGGGERYCIHASEWFREKRFEWLAWLCLVLVQAGERLVSERSVATPSDCVCNVTGGSQDNEKHPKFPDPTPISS
jgi:hypothetical protein